MVFYPIKCKQYLTEIDQKKKDERQGGDYDEGDDDDNDEKEEDYTYNKSVQMHITERTESQITTTTEQMKPKCQHVDDGEYNNMLIYIS